jgi:hypothetical protein
MITSISSFLLSIPNGITDYSEVLSVPVNSNLQLLNNINNAKIKKITCRINLVVQFSEIQNNISFWDFRFQGLNRDGSLITQNAGIIINPISGDWGSAFVKDTILDFNLSSKKNFIDFYPFILLGGIRPQSFSVKFSNPTSGNLNIIQTTTLFYE